MLGVTSPAMVAAVSEAGGLGSLPVGGLSPHETSLLIGKVKRLTGKPFAVNLFAHALPLTIEQESFQAMQDFLDRICRPYGILVKKKAPEQLIFYGYRDQVASLIKAKVPIVSFTFGLPDAPTVSLLKQYGITLIATATSLEEALMAEACGMDLVTLQGLEAGGHQGSFLPPGPEGRQHTQDLLRQVIKQLQIPALAAGGLMEGTAIATALRLGASGVQLGSAFLRCDESLASQTYKQTIASSTGADTVLTCSLTGRCARGISNTLIRELEASGLQIPPYPIQNSLTGAVRIQAKNMHIPAFQALWAGQHAFQAKAAKAADILDVLVSETRASLATFF